MSSPEAKQQGKSAANCLKRSWGGHPQAGGWTGPSAPWVTSALPLSRVQAPRSWGHQILSQQGRKRQSRSLRCVSDISRDPIVPISENFVFFVKLPFIFTNGHRKPLLFKVRLLFFSNGCFF